MLEGTWVENNSASACKFAGQTLFDAAPAAMAVTCDGKLLHINREFTRLFGYDSAACLGQDIDALLLPGDRRQENEILYDSVATEGRAAIETTRKTAGGAVLAVSVLVAPYELGGNSVGLFHIFRDIRQQKEQEARLHFSATHDAVTGLANRTLFLDRLRLTLARLQRRPERSFAVMLLHLDIDQYERTHPALRSGGADAVMQETTQRLHERIRPFDTVSRYDGDVFALLLDEASERRDVENIAQRLREAAQMPMVIEGLSVALPVTLGIVMVTPEYLAGDDVMRSANLALMMAKMGGNAGQAFAPKLNVSGATMQPCLVSARSRQPA
jgi:diguanylate cyclase (GGDEF)-like protein/PAS domain S-box-containing protein